MLNTDSKLDNLIQSLKDFLFFSFHENEESMNKWIQESIGNIKGNCWVKTNCNQKNCPGYQNECGRCWITAGTMCCGDSTGKFVDKFLSCADCNIYIETVGDNKIDQVRELVIALINTLLLKQEELRAALDEIKMLKGIIPICSYCYKIRNDKGSWNQLEAYILEHSHEDAQFSHGVCPDCYKREMLNLDQT